MSHYSKVELYSVINGQDFQLSISQEMQDHLSNCDVCMELYLELMDGFELGERSATENLTDRVMELVYKENEESSQRKLKQKRINTLVYYVSAASITLFLMRVGAFQDIYQSFSSVEKQVYESPKRQSLFTSGWTNRLTDVTSKFLNGIKINN